MLAYPAWLCRYGGLATLAWMWAIISEKTPEPGIFAFQSIYCSQKLTLAHQLCCIETRVAYGEDWF